MATSLYPVRFPDQLRQHLRALRKARRLTQAQLGMLLGVSQARVAEIEANPGTVSVEQLMKILALLDASLALQEKTRENVSKSEENPGEAAHAKSPATDAGPANSAPETAARHSRPTENEAESGSRKRMLIQPRKGSW